MSTRANIIITDGDSSLIFYRHSDGYPTGVQETLQKFIDWVAEGKIRNNTCQAAGWLVMLGALEYATIPKGYKTVMRGSSTYKYKVVKSYGDLKDDGFQWKVGAYEPTTCIHGDIEYLYLIDLSKPSVKLLKDWGGGDFNEDFVKNAKGKIILKPTAPKATEKPVKNSLVVKTKKGVTLVVNPQ